MTLNELRSIVAVGQELNFRRAAEKSFISQPALSLAVQKLAEELGVQIFERGKREISVTPIGAQIIEQAQRVLEDAGHIREIASRGNDQLSGALRVGITQSNMSMPCATPATTPKPWPGSRRSSSWVGCNKRGAGSAARVSTRRFVGMRQR